MAKGKKQSYSKTGISVPEYSLIQAGMKPFKTSGITRDYTRLMDDALWYVHYEVDNKIIVKEYQKYIAAHVCKDIASQLRNARDHLMIVPGKYAYIANNGATLTEEHHNMIVGTLEAVLSTVKLDDPSENTTLDEKPVKKNVISIQDRMWDQAAELIGSFEERLDLLVSGSEEFDLRKFDPYREIARHEPAIKPAHAKLVRKFFEATHAEAKLLVDWKDDEVKEAFPQFTARAQERKRYLKFFDEIITACDTVINTGKATRKTRSKKAPDKQKIVSKVKFKEAEASLGLASINPTDILDKSILWVYNTKNRKLIKYVADELVGSLSIKGTTLVGFSESKSTQRTMRKPELLKGSNKLTRSKFDKFNKELTTTQTKVNGRLNEHCILISVF